MPKVSICVPAYQNPEGVKRLLKSVREQTFTDYEVIVTDDSDGDAVLKASGEAGIASLRYYKNEKRLGATANWNEAVRRAGGQYIKMMHHDDWFSGPESLARFVELLDDSPDASLAFSGTWQVTLPDSGPEEKTARHISAGNEALIREDWRNLFLGNFIGAPSAVICRRNDLIYETRLTWLMDVEYYMRLLQTAPRFASSDEPLVCIGVSDSQLTEQCRGDGELNLYEYGFLFSQFGLQTENRYCEKLIAVALKYNLPWQALEAYGIGKKAYGQAAAREKKEDFRFLLGVAKRKLTGKQ